MKIVAYVPDLMDRSRFPAALDVTFVSSLADLSSTEAGTVVADLARDGALDSLMNLDNPSVRKVGFIPHEQKKVIELATAKGIQALPRSRFFSQIAQILRDPL